MVSELQGFIGDFGAIAYTLYIPVDGLKALLKDFSHGFELLGSWGKVCPKEAGHGQ